MRREWQIKLVLTEQQQNQSGTRLMLENLRYAGTLGRENVLDNSTFYIYCPKGLHPKTWAEANCKRMRTFSLDATPVLR